MKTPASSPASGHGPIAILGVPFDSVTLAETLTLVAEMIASGKPHYATTVGVNFLSEAMGDVELRRILFDAHLILAEEEAVVRASKILGNPLPGSVTVAHLMPQLLSQAERKGWRVFLLGGAPADAAVAEKIQKRHPYLNLVGVYSPPDKPLLEMDQAEILRRLRAAKPDILLVAFGCPKQEKWINMNYRDAGVPFVLGAGTTFDFLTGAVLREKQLSWTEWWRFYRAVLRQWWQLRAKKTAPTAGIPAVTGDPYGNFIIRAPARIGPAETQALQGEWLASLENGHVMFDLTNTVFADSTGIGVLIRLRRRARELNRQFILVGARPPIGEALKLMKLDEFFSMQPSLAGARILMESAARTPAVSSGVREKELQIRWTGEVTALNAVELGAYTESELSQISPDMSVVIDLARVTFVDSTGIGLMLRFKKNLLRSGLTLTFANATEPVRNTIRHTQLEDYLLGPPK